jgi:hypothetical protein
MPKITVHIYGAVIRPNDGDAERTKPPAESAIRLCRKQVGSDQWGGQYRRDLLRL